MILGLAEPLNYGLSMPPEQLRRDWGMLRHAAVSQRAGGQQAACWQTVCKASPCILQETLHEPHHYPTSPTKVSWRLNHTW